MKSRSILLYLLLVTSPTVSVTYKLTHPGYNSGLFCVFHTVLGALDFYENSSDCSGLIVDFADRGLYYDTQHGLNWWEYYFEPIRLCPHDTQLSEFTDTTKANFAWHAHSKMSRERGNELIQKYIHLKPHLQIKLNGFIEKYFIGNRVIGVHYRGTDKKEEAQTITYKEVVDLIDQETDFLNSAKIFVATDDANFLVFMHKKFPGKIVSLDAIRSQDEKPVHCCPGNEYQKGEEAVLDCLLLSQCTKLYKMVSNLSDASAKFNPFIPVINLNHYLPDKAGPAMPTDSI